MTNIVGVFGSGPSTRKHTAALLDDWDAEHPIDTLVAPGTEQDFTAAVRHTVDWAQSKSKAITLVVTDATSDAPWLEDYQGVGSSGIAVIAHPHPDIYTATKVTHLLLAFDDSQSGVSETLAEQALDKGVVVMDLTDGLFPITRGAEEPAKDVNVLQDEAQQVTQYTPGGAVLVEVDDTVTVEVKEIRRLLMVLAAHLGVEFDLIHQ